jgi:hypothetical protein
MARGSCPIHSGSARPTGADTNDLGRRRRPGQRRRIDQRADTRRGHHTRSGGAPRWTVHRHGAAAGGRPTGTKHRVQAAHGRCPLEPDHHPHRPSSRQLPPRRGGRERPGNRHGAKKSGHGCRHRGRGGSRPGAGGEHRTVARRQGDQRPRLRKQRRARRRFHRPHPWRDDHHRQLHAVVRRGRRRRQRCEACYRNELPDGRRARPARPADR